MPTPFAAGENYSIELSGDVAVVKVWRVPEMESAVGARLAGEIALHVKKLASQKLRGVMLDVHKAPPVAGPRTVETLSELLGACEKAGVQIAVLVSGDPMQQLQFRRLITSFAPTRGRTTTDAADAVAWIARRPRPR
jgi:hypothetical protein